MNDVIVRPDEHTTLVDVVSLEEARRKTAKALTAMRWFFRGLEHGAPLAALGLPPDATPEQCLSRLSRLRRLFDERGLDLSRDQRSQLDAARAALWRVSRRLLHSSLGIL